MESADGPLREGIFLVVAEEVQGIEVPLHEVLDEEGLFLGESEPFHDLNHLGSPHVLVIVEVVVSRFIRRVGLRFSDVVEEGGKGDKMFLGQVG